MVGVSSFQNAGSAHARIQCCENMAACILTCQKEDCHITPSFKVLHWLPVEYRIQRKVLLHVFCTLNGLSRDYLMSTLEQNVQSLPLEITASSRHVANGPRKGTLLERLHVHSVRLAWSFGMDCRSLCEVHLLLIPSKGS